MKKWGMILVVLLLSLMPVSAAHAQYEGTNAKYYEKQRQQRANRTWIKLAIAGGFLVISGAAWAYKKVSGKD